MSEQAKISTKPSPNKNTHPLIRWIKPKSIAWRTTLVVGIVALFSQMVTLVFMWQLFYSPELTQHAKFLASQIRLSQHISTTLSEQDQLIWREQLHIIDQIDPKSTPKIKRKIISELFTDEVDDALSNYLRQPVTVYFEIKPTPRLWIRLEQHPNIWYMDPLDAYGNYQITWLLLWLFGIPLLTFWAILILVRQLNRPLARLQATAQQYSQHKQAPLLDTNHGSIEMRQVNHAFNDMLLQIERIEQERATMLAGISHDIRSPLTRIRLSAELMDDEIERQAIINDIEDINNILQQFLDFMNTGEDEGLKTVNLVELCQEVIHSFRHKNIRLMGHSLQHPVQLRPMSIKRIISNLIQNALKYGAEPIVIHLEQDDDFTYITVSDHGKTQTMSPEQLATLFYPFMRGDKARTEQGSGLGLAIVEKIIRKHHGEAILGYTETGGFEVRLKIPVNQ